MSDKASLRQHRLNRVIEHRLRSAAPALRAMALAESVGWEAPDFPATVDEQETMEAFLRACNDARRAARPAAGPLDQADSSFENGSAAQANDPVQLIALDGAIAASNRAVRLLRQQGLKPNVATREGTDGMLVRADLTFDRDERGTGTA